MTLCVMTLRNSLHFDGPNVVSEASANGLSVRQLQKRLRHGYTMNYFMPCDRQSCVDYRSNDSIDWKITTTIKRWM